MTLADNHQPVLVTVAMSVFNGEPAHLDSAIESILNQTFKAFELLVLNDGSDNLATLARLEHWQTLDLRVRVIHRRHEGLTSSLNHLIREAKGHYFARMDGDDVALPQRLGVQANYLREHPAAVLVGSWFDLIDGIGNKIKTVRTATRDKDIVASLYRKHNVIAHPSVMLRTHELRCLGGYDERFGPSGSTEDYELWTRILNRGELQVLPQVLLKYRLSNITTSFVHADLQRRDYWVAWRMLRLRTCGSPRPYESALAQLARFPDYYGRRFKAEAFRLRADRLSLLGDEHGSRILLYKAFLTAPWNVRYLVWWFTSFLRVLVAVVHNRSSPTE